MISHEAEVKRALRLTYVMVGKLEDAGLIVWETCEPIGSLARVRAKLTDAGHDALRTDNSASTAKGDA